MERQKEKNLLEQKSPWILLQSLGRASDLCLRKGTNLDDAVVLDGEHAGDAVIVIVIVILILSLGPRRRRAEVGGNRSGAELSPEDGCNACR